MFDMFFCRPAFVFMFSYFFRMLVFSTSNRRYCNPSCWFVGVFVREHVCLWVCEHFRSYMNMQISLKPLEIEARLQWSTCRKWHIANQVLVIWLMTSRDPLRVSGVARAWRRFRSPTAFSSFYRAIHFSAFARSCDRMSSVCPSVCPSVTLVICDHIGWKSWKLIAWAISPTSSLFAAKRRSTYSQGNMEKFLGD